MPFLIFLTIVAFCFYQWKKGNKDSSTIKDQINGFKKEDIGILHFVLFSVLDKLTAEERIEFRDQMGAVKQQLRNIRGSTIDVENLVFSSKNATVTKVLELVREQATKAPTQYQREVSKDAFLDFLASNI